MKFIPSRAMLAVGLFLCALSASAQTLGELTGRVGDPSGAAVGGASIVLTSISTNAVRNTMSTDAGDYSFPSLAPGFYKLKAEHVGFKAAISNDIEIQVQQTVRLDITFQVGQVSESIEVAASADLLAGGERHAGHGD